MQPSAPLAIRLQQISASFIQTSFYDPTTCYLENSILDRDEFKKLKKDGLIEASFGNKEGKRYTLSNKGREYLSLMEQIVLS